MSSIVKAEIAEKKQIIEELEKKVAEVRADTAVSLRAVNVQTRYASRVQSTVRSDSPDAFGNAMRALIDADLAALLMRGK